MQENIKEKDENTTVYECSYLLLPSLATEQVPSLADGIKNAIVGLGGVVFSDESPILIDLAYPMTKVVQTTRHKCDTGYFGWMKFEMPAEGIEAVKKALDANNEVLRYIIIKTARENTLLHGKMMLRKEEKVKKPVEGEVEMETSGDDIGAEPVKEGLPSDLDKSIDDLVIA